MIYILNKKEVNKKRRKKTMLKIISKVINQNYLLGKAYKAI
jgi:hypothetical protein